MAMAGRIGAAIALPAAAATRHGYLFGEDQARYVVTVPAGGAEALIAAAASAGVAATHLGQVGGDRLDIEGIATISVCKAGRCP